MGGRRHGRAGGRRHGRAGGGVTVERVGGVTVGRGKASRWKGGWRHGRAGERQTFCPSRTGDAAPPVLIWLPVRPAQAEAVAAALTSTAGSVLLCVAMVVPRSVSAARD